MRHTPDIFRLFRPLARWSIGVLAMLALAVAPGCESSSDDDDNDDEAVCTLEWEDATLDDQTICDAGQFTGAFSTNSNLITNAFLPFSEGSTATLEGEEDGESIRIEIEVLTTDTVAGVNVRVVNEAEYIDDELAEDTMDWYAQADNGSVCYFGEDVTNYEEDGSTNSGGSWTADFDTALPGIIMPAEDDIEVGAIYIQERVPDIAEDMSEITDIGEEIETDVATYTDTFSGNDCNPLDREPEDKKIYARNVGLVYDAGVKLTAFTTP